MCQDRLQASLVKAVTARCESSWHFQQGLVRAKLLLVQGTDRFVKDLELHVLENCSHWVQQDKPEEVHRLMRGFLKRTAPATAVGAVAA